MQVLFYAKKIPSHYCEGSGDSTGIRTRVAAVRGRSLDRLTIEPCHLLII